MPRNLSPNDNHKIRSVTALTDFSAQWMQEGAVTRISVACSPALDSSTVLFVLKVKMNRLALFLFVACLFPKLEASSQDLQTPLTFWAPLSAPRVHYKIEGRIQSSSTLDAEFSETVDFTNTTGRTIQLLALNEATWCGHEPEIRARGRLIDVMSRDEQGNILSRASLALAPALEPNGKLHLDIRATCHIDDTVPDEEQFQHWYPQIW